MFMKMDDEERVRRTGGFALVVALGFGVALAALAAGTTREAQGSLRIASGAIAAAEARAAAEAALWRAASSLSAAANGDETRSAPMLDGTPSVWRFEGVATAVRATAESALTDLNTAHPAALVATAAAAAHPDPQAFAAATLDRRAAQTAVGISWRIAPRAFDAVDQARDFADPETWARLGPLLTVHSGLAKPAETPTAPRVGGAYRLIAIAEGPDGARSGLRAVILLKRDGRLSALEWRAVGP